ncbi:lipopolysaccharide biosynthesis protein RfbH [Patescibacteria group bacterium]
MNDNLKKNIIEEFENRFPKKNFVPGESPVPVSGKIFDEKELLLMTESVLEGWWTEGKFTGDFESRIAEFIGVKHCSAVNSGSSANLLALVALTSHLLGDRKIEEGDEVITVAAGFPTTVNPIIQAGCVPVFVDIEMGTFDIDADKMKEALSEKTKAVMIAHTLGNPFNIKKVKDFCDKNGLWLIEDNCDALGSEYEGKRTGSFGDIATLSFYPAHHITTAEGGAVLTDNPVLHKAIVSLRDWGRECWCPTGHDDTCKSRFKWKSGNLPDGYDHKYVYSHIGYNLKMTEMQAACGLAQMDRLSGFVEKRKENYVSLMRRLKKFDKYFDFSVPTENSDPSWFGFIMTVKDDCGFSREDLMKFLNDKKIGTRLLFGGNLTKQPYFLNYKIKHRIVGELKNTDTVMDNTFWIGVYPGINGEMMNWIEESFKEFLSSEGDKQVAEQVSISEEDKESLRRIISELESFKEKYGI